MHFSATIIGTIALFSVTAFAVPNELTPKQEPVAIQAKLIPESIANATALGVDVWGPIPDDATKGDGYYTAEPGTLGWAWIRAQQDLVEYENLLESRGLPVPVSAEKRQSTDIRLNMYAGEACSGRSWYFIITGYGHSILPGEDVYVYSFGFASRTLRSNEHVEVRSGPYDGDACANYHSFLQGPTEVGACWGVPATSCFRLYG